MTDAMADLMKPIPTHPDNTPSSVSPPSPVSPQPKEPSSIESEKKNNSEESQPPAKKQKKKCGICKKSFTQNTHLNTHLLCSYILTVPDKTSSGGEKEAV